jgi:purine-binding chemotaxis protein CheW
MAEQHESAGRTLDVLLFELDGLRVAVFAAEVQEVLRAAAPAALPRAPAAVLGVLNVRGTLVPVLDLRARFRLPPRSLRHTDHLLVVRPRDARTCAIAVDRAASLRALPISSLHEAELRAEEAEHVGCIAALEDGSLVILDLAGFLAADEAAALDEALDDAQRESAPT